MRLSEKGGGIVRLSSHLGCCAKLPLVHSDSTLSSWLSERGTRLGRDRCVYRSTYRYPEHDVLEDVGALVEISVSSARVLGSFCFDDGVRIPPQLLAERILGRRGIGGIVFGSVPVVGYS